MTLSEYLKNKNIPEFAKTLNISRQHLYALSKNKRKPSPKLALKIEQITNGEVEKTTLLYSDFNKTN